jgi:hypothetical protein
VALASLDRLAVAIPPATIALKHAIPPGNSRK